MSEKTPIDDETEGESDVRAEVTLNTARDRRDRLLQQGFANGSPVLIEALPVVGKSYGIVKWAAQTGNPVTIFTERHELYDQYERWATENFDLSVEQLPVFHIDCPSVKETESIVSEGTSYQITAIQHGMDDEEWSDKIRTKYERGISGRELHDRATEYFGEKLPCQRDGTCPYIEALERDFTDVDILIGNFRQVFAEQYRKDRYLVFDEFPSESFVQSFSAVPNTVSNYVSHSDLPFDNYRDVMEYDRTTANNSDVKNWLKKHQSDRDTKPLRGIGSQLDAHGPLLTEIILRFENLNNGWQRADLGEGRIAVLSPNNDQISLLDPPPTDGAKGVVALDGTPSIEKWKLLFGADLHHYPVFIEDEKRQFLRDVLKLRLIQTAETTKPYRSGRNVTPDKDMAFIEAVKEREDQRPSLISSRRAIKDYEEYNIEKFVDKTSYYNNIKGSGKLGADRLGVVIGCDQPGDDHIELWGALAGLSITAKTDENGQRLTGLDLDFGTFGNKILEDSRESEVLQAAMRFGRDEVDGDRGATVYVHTAALPDWVEPEKQIPKIHSWEDNGGVVKVIEAIKNRDDWQNGEWKTSDIADAVDTLSDRQVLKILRDMLADEGYITSRRGGRGNAHIWSNTCLEDTGAYGIVEW